jgi:hypothetical protein
MDLLESRRDNRGPRSSNSLVSEHGKAMRPSKGRKHQPREKREETDFGQIAFVFWDQHPGMQPGQVTRFDRLDDAIDSVMQEPSAQTERVAWIRTSDRHLSMEEIRVIARQQAARSK